MKYFLTKSVLLLWMLLFALWSGEPAFAQTACSLRAPPSDAAVTGDHGSFYFVYPRKVTPAYTGCQTMWDELGRAVFVFRFTKGVLTEYSLTDYSGESKSQLCKYEHKRLSVGSPLDCSAYDDVRQGLLNGEPDEDPAVPKARDARLKHPNPTK